MKKIYKYPTGAEIPQGAIYLNTVTQTQIRESVGKPYETCFLVWHYFLVDFREQTGNKDIILSEISDEEQVYISAVRYALGRMSYIVSVTTEFILQKKLSAKCIEVILNDIARARDMGSNGLGMDIDKKHWEELEAYLKADQEQNK